MTTNYSSNHKTSNAPSTKVGHRRVQIMWSLLGFLAMVFAVGYLMYISDLVAHTSLDNRNQAEEQSFVSDSPHYPQMTIGFPEEGQAVILDVDRVFCMVDVPVASTSGLLRRESINGATMSGYLAHTTLCYEPRSGANSLQVQYKNEAGFESPVIDRLFTMEWTCPAEPHANYDSRSNEINLADYVNFLHSWRNRSARGNYNCSDAVDLQDYIQFLQDWRLH